MLPEWLKKFEEIKQEAEEEVKQIKKLIK